MPAEACGCCTGAVCENAGDVRVALRQLRCQGKGVICSFWGSDVAAFERRCARISELSRGIGTAAAE
jgi:hypothetical protein